MSKRFSGYWFSRLCNACKAIISGKHNARSMVDISHAINWWVATAGRPLTNVPWAAAASHDDTLYFFHKLLRPALSCLFPQRGCLFQQLYAFLPYFRTRLRRQLWRKKYVRFNGAIPFITYTYHVTSTDQCTILRFTICTGVDQHLGEILAQPIFRIKDCLPLIRGQVPEFRCPGPQI